MGLKEDKRDGGKGSGRWTGLRFIQIQDKWRICIHVREQYCMHFCQCGYQHLSRDQVADRQRTTRYPGHGRAKCKVYIITEKQFPAFRQPIKLPTSKSFEKLLPTQTSQSQIKDKPQPTTVARPEMPKERERAVNMMAPPGYQIPRRMIIIETSPAEASCQPMPEPPASPPVQSGTRGS